MTNPVGLDLLSADLTEIRAEFVRPKEILVPNRWTRHAEAFSVVVDAFMDSDEHQLIEYGDPGVHIARIDRYLQDDDVVYSIIHRPPRLAIAGVHQATSVIRGHDERYYGERHIFKEGLVNGSDGDMLIPPHRGVDHPLESLDWENLISPLTRALQSRRAVVKSNQLS